MKAVKNQTFLSACAVAALVITPIIVFAAVYHSMTRDNAFQPGVVDITIRENSVAETMQTKALTLDNQNPVDKWIEIKDARTNSNEALRVCFVPLWFEKNDESTICGNVCDLGTPSMANGILQYPGGLKLTLKGNWNFDTITNKWTSDNSWIYRPDENCFFYFGSLEPESDSLTPTLLKSVTLSDAALSAASAYTFRLDVLADAIQTSGNAAETRSWTPQS